MVHWTWLCIYGMSSWICTCRMSSAEFVYNYIWNILWWISDAYMGICLMIVLKLQSLLLICIVHDYMSASTFCYIGNAMLVEHIERADNFTWLILSQSTEYIYATYHCTIIHLLCCLVKTHVSPVPRLISIVPVVAVKIPQMALVIFSIHVNVECAFIFSLSYLSALLLQTLSFEIVQSMW